MNARFFFHFLSRARAENVAEALREEGFQVWDIKPGWDDPFWLLEVRRELGEAQAVALELRLVALAKSLDGDYSGYELVRTAEEH